MDLDFVSVHKNAKKELGQYPAILTSRLVNNAYISRFVRFDPLELREYPATLRTALIWEEEWPAIFFAQQDSGFNCLVATNGSLKTEKKGIY